MIHSAFFRVHEESIIIQGYRKGIYFYLLSCQRQAKRLIRSHSLAKRRDIFFCPLKSSSCAEYENAQNFFRRNQKHCMFSHPSVIPFSRPLLFFRPGGSTYWPFFLVLLLSSLASHPSSASLPPPSPTRPKSPGNSQAGIGRPVQYLTCWTLSRETHSSRKVLR